MVGKYTLQSVGMALLSQGDEEWVCICSNTGRGLWNCLDKYYEEFSKSLRSNVIRYTDLYILLQSVAGKISAEALCSAMAHHIWKTCSWQKIFFYVGCWCPSSLHHQVICSHGIYNHDDIIKWKHFQHYWPFVRGIHRSPVNSPHKGQWRRALMFSLICTWTNGWIYNR